MNRIWEVVRRNEFKCKFVSVALRQNCDAFFHVERNVVVAFHCVCVFASNALNDVITITEIRTKHMNCSRSLYDLKMRVMRKTEQNILFKLHVNGNIHAMKFTFLIYNKSNEAATTAFYCKIMPYFSLLLPIWCQGKLYPPNCRTWSSDNDNSIVAKLKLVAGWP